MAKESRHQRDERKKPTMTLKEKRAKKLAKRQQKVEHVLDEHAHVEDFI